MIINPNRLPYIVKIATTFFEHANKAINPNPNKAVEMHYVADMFKELVNTAYPMKDEEREIEKHLHVIDIPNSIDPSFLADALNRIFAKIKDGEF